MKFEKKDVARILGMKEREVVEWDGHVATLHDGTRFEFNENGQYRQLRRVQATGPLPQGFVADWMSAPAGVPVRQPVVEGARPVRAENDGPLPAGAAAGPRPVAPSDPGMTDLVSHTGPAQGADEEVPAGSADDVLEWVGADQTRAARALALEKAADKPRSTLVGKLEKLAAG